MCDLVVPGIRTVMLAGMIKIPADIWSSVFSRGTGGFPNVSISDSMDVFLVLCFFFDFGEGVLDFFKVFNYFPVRVWDLVFDAPVGDFCDDFAAFGGIFTDLLLIVTI